MRVGMILESFFPPDIRVEKEARRLIESGHEVFLLTLCNDNDTVKEIINGIHVFRINFNYNIIKRAVNFSLLITFFINYFWYNNIDSFVEKYKIEIIHVHDLPLVKTGLIVARKHKIPIIADLHENYPEALKEWRKAPHPPYLKLLHSFTSPSRFTRMALTILPKVDHIIAVIDEGKKIYSLDYQISDDRITTIMNTEDLNYYDSISIHQKIVNKYANNFVMLYVGGFGPHRGIETAINALPEIIDKIPHAKLLLVGGGGSPEYAITIHDLCKKLKLENNIEFTGWVNFNHVPSYIACSSVCLIPHLASGHTNSTIPHKLFQYMAMKKPIITTDCLPLKRIVEETNSGIVVPSGISSSMAQAVITLFNNPNMVIQYGENGRKAVETKYNWKIESEKLIRLYKEFSN